MSKPILFIGNKNYSSWSLRPWLALKWAGIDFEERIIPLGGPGYGKSAIPEIRAVSPSGRVPSLHLGAARIWDSLAIVEWAAETAPHLWPSDAVTRAVCRSAASEMHSSFGALRRDLAMNVRRRTAARIWADDTRADIARVVELWSSLRDVHGAKGPFLFGERSCADAMFAPVCTRFRTYGVHLPDIARAYCNTVLEDDAFLQWELDANAEPWTLPETDHL